MGELPLLKLRLETHPTIPPTPMCFHIFSSDKDLGIITLPELKRAVEQLEDKGPPLPKYLSNNL